jgi:nitrate reductase NapE component
MLCTPVATVALVGGCSFCRSIYGLIARDANVAWNPPIFNVYPMAVELVFGPEGPSSQ